MDNKFFHQSVVFKNKILGKIKAYRVLAVPNAAFHEILSYSHERIG